MREWLEQAKSKGMSLGLERVETALEKLGRPDKKMSCIHVAGSNGKGSACAQLAAGLIRGGYTVGLFSSPHVSRIEERIRMQGRPISKQDFNDALAQVKALNLELTFFEITFLIAVLSCSEEAISARFTTLEPGTIMDEAGDLAERLCAMLGLKFTRRQVNWPARMQYIGGDPAILLDAAHNPSGMARVMPEIAAKLPEKWSLLLGCSPQEDMEDFLRPLFNLMMYNPPIEIITTEPQGGRYPGVKQPIAEVTHIEKPEEAIGSFSQNCDMILVIGSLYLCGNILTFLQLDSDDNLDILSSIGGP